MEHQISYRALASGNIDVTNLYSTDAEIKAYDITTLEDDLGVFPAYEAIYLYRLDTAERYPAFLRSIFMISGNVDQQQMIAMNAAVRDKGKTEGDVAADFLRGMGVKIPAHRDASRLQQALSGMLEDTLRHLLLVFLPLLLLSLIHI